MDTPHLQVIISGKALMAASAGTSSEVELRAYRKSQQHFARVFRSVCGASPAQYRLEFVHQDEPSA